MEREVDLVSATPFVGTFTLSRSRFMPQFSTELDEEPADANELLGADFEDMSDEEEAPETVDLELIGDPEMETELDEDSEGAFDAETGFDPASNEGASYELTDSADETVGEIDGFDGELFQQLVTLGPAVEQALVSAQIAGGQRDVTALTDFVFFVRHPELKGTRLGAGQDALIAEWRSIREAVVRPALARATAATTSSTPSAGVSAGALGTLVCAIPGRTPFRYAFTKDDLVWTARFINGEAGGRDDAQNRSIIWAMFNRYAFFRNQTPGWGSFGDFIRQYSTPLQPFLKKFSQVKDWVAKCNATFDDAGCNYQPTRTEVYPGTNIRKGQLKSHLALQKMRWDKLSVGSRKLATEALAGDVPNPIGNASEFGDTAVYFFRQHRERPSRSEWEAYTRAYAAKMKWLWQPEQVPYDQFGNNVIFINGAAKNFPPNATSVERGTGVSAPASTAPSTTRQPNGFGSLGREIGTAFETPAVAAARAGGDPSSVLIYDGNTPASGTTETRRSHLTTPPITGSASNRNRLLYENVINQFAVGVNPRYAHRFNKEKKTWSTFCNIFLWDVTRAMGAEIPHWVNRSGEPVGVGKGNELSANGVCGWIQKHGTRYGWRRIESAEQAQTLANAGHPTVLVWNNPRGIGHVSVVRPGTLNDHGPEIAQAGGKNVNRARVYTIFRRSAQIEYWGNWS